MDSGGTDVGREFSSGLEDGERRKMDVWEDFEGIFELEEVDKELLRAEFTDKTVIERERTSVEGSITWRWDHQLRVRRPITISQLQKAKAMSHHRTLM